MTALEKKVFTSSNPMTVLLSCPPLCGHFSIQESAKGGLSYKVKKSTEQIECPFCTLYAFYNYLFKNYILLTLHLIVKLKEWFS